MLDKNLKAFIKKKGYIPSSNQFTHDVMRQVEKKLKSELNCFAFEWPKDTYLRILARTTFYGQIIKKDHHYINFKVMMDNDGPRMIVVGKNTTIMIKESKSTPDVNPTPKVNKAKSTSKNKVEPISKNDSDNQMDINSGFIPSLIPDDIPPFIPEDIPPFVPEYVKKSKPEKPHMPPNYNMLANDWINENLAALNEACLRAMGSNQNASKVEAFLDKEILPADKNGWAAIGQAFVEQEEIDGFKVTAEGIKIFITL